MMFHRDITDELCHLAKDYPVVTVIGPRQSGKTTLVREVFPHKPYVNLEDPEQRRAAKADPKAMFAQYPEGLIIDEIQRVPELLSYIQVIVDEENIKGKYILTGSHQLALHEAITQSLAGRTALLTLLPLSMKELQQAGIHLSIDDYLLQGQFPRIHNDKLEPRRAYANYVQTYIERDVRQLIHLKDIDAFQKFLKLCASRVGQTINFDNISNALGISSASVKNWLSILEASFVIFRLQPYFENFGKRLIKTPKLYFTDVGLLSYLLDIENIEQIQRDPLRGHLFENLVVLELMKTRLNQGLNPQLYYYRDSHQNEVDVIFKQGNQLIPIEIKSSMTLSSDFFKGLRYFQNLVKERSQRAYLIYAGQLTQRIDLVQVMYFENASTVFAD